MANLVSATALRTEKTAGIVIPTAARHNFSGFLNKMQKRLLDAKVKPAFFIMASGPINDGLRSSLNQSVAQITVLEEELPFGQRLINGTTLASKGSDIVLLTCDDFDHLLEPVGRFAARIGTDNEMLFGRWAKLSHAFLPYPLFLNEAGMSMLVTYAHPKHPANLKPGLPTLQNYTEFRQYSTHRQVYIGLEGFVSSKWGAICAAADGLFNSLEGSWQGVGFEAVLMLVGNHLGLDIREMRVPKRFEHPLLEKDSHTYAKDAWAYAQSRVGQFESGAKLVAHYVQNTQTEKAGFVLRYIEDVSQKIKNSDFYWPAPHENWPKQSKWNLPVQTAYSY